MPLRRAVPEDILRGASGNPLATKVGIEIEFAGDQAEVIRQFQRHNIPVQRASYSQFAEDAFTVKNDGSVSNGGETCSFPMEFGPSSYELMQQVAKAMEAAGASTCEAAGTHIHVDATHLTDEDIAMLLAGTIRFEDSYYRMATSGWPTMRGSWGTYCQPITRAVKAELLATNFEPGPMREVIRANLNRGGLNLANFFGSEARKKTIEFRYFNSSLNPERWWAWIAWCVGTVRAAQLRRFERPTLSPEVVHPLGAMASEHRDEKLVLQQHMRVLNTATLPEPERRIIKKHWILGEPVQPNNNAWSYPGWDSYIQGLQAQRQAVV